MARDPVTIHGGSDLKRIARELRRMNQREVLKRFRKDLRKAARPLVPAVRQSIRQIPSKRAYTAQGLRGQLSRATAIEVKTGGKSAGVAIRVDGRKMPNHAKSLPAYMEGTKKRWRHPVYGNRAVWVQMQPAHPYFYKVMRASGPAARAVVDKTIRKIARDIT